ncbi:MAG: N-acetylmuramoyl-L-alanine amidase [Saprospiraceae bacterium]|nr:N-acetylmuramoyl-L-alanine amidase [Saprospiraceae bacterium]
MKQSNTRFATRLGVIFILFLTEFTSFAAVTYVQIKPKSGENLFMLFRKYAIEPNSCNINHFKEINRIKNLEKILIGVTYNLPILKYQYNGKSITTSIPNMDRPTAVKIMNYNKSLYQNKLKKVPYTENKIVWVVYDQLGCKKGSSPDVAEKSKPNGLAKPTLVASKEKSTLTKVTIASSSSESNIKPINSAPVKDMTGNIKTEPNIRENEAIIATETTTNATALKTKIVPIFGPDFQEIRIVSEELKNKVYYLVSGHGGPDPGTMYKGSKMTLCEDEYAYDVTLRLARKLMEHGATVHLIVQDPNDGIRNESYLKIDHDEKCITGYPLVLNQRLRLTQTTDAVNDLYRKYRKQGVDMKDQIAVHIHIDSRHEDMRKDVYFYYQEGNQNSTAIAKRIQNTLDQKYKEQSGREYTGTISSRNLFVMRNTLPSTVYMELGNIQNQLDQKRIVYSSNRQALAEWLYDGIAAE